MKKTLLPLIAALIFSFAANAQKVYTGYVDFSEKSYKVIPDTKTNQKSAKEYILMVLKKSVGNNFLKERKTQDMYQMSYAIVSSLKIKDLGRSKWIKSNFQTKDNLVVLV